MTEETDKKQQKCPECGGWNRHRFTCSEAMGALKLRARNFSSPENRSPETMKGPPPPEMREVTEDCDCGKTTRPAVVESPRRHTSAI